MISGNQLFDATQLFTRFFRLVDDQDHQGLLDLLHPEAIWKLHGHEHDVKSVRAAFALRPTTRRVRHMLASVFSEFDADDVAVNGYMLVVEHDDGKPLQGPAPLEGLAAVLTVRARLRQTAQGLRFIWIEDEPPAFLRSLEAVR